MNQQKSEIVRELISKPTTKRTLVLFAIPKLYRKYQSLKDGLCKKIHNSSSFFFTQK